MSIFSHSGYGYSKTICQTTTTWFLNKHLSEYEIGNLEVVHKGLKRDDSWGYCDNIDGGYRIELQSGMRKELYIRTLIHELIHVDQNVRGLFDDQKRENEAYILEKKLGKKFMLENEPCKVS